MPPSVTSSRRLGSAMASTRVIGSTSAVSTSPSCSTQSRIALSSRCRLLASCPLTLMRASRATWRTVASSTFICRPSAEMRNCEIGRKPCGTCETDSAAFAAAQLLAGGGHRVFTRYCCGAGAVGENPAIVGLRLLKAAELLVLPRYTGGHLRSLRLSTKSARFRTGLLTCTPRLRKPERVCRTD